MKKENQPVEELNEELNMDELETGETPEVEIDEMAELTAKIEQLQDQLLRNAAEVENFKRRMNEEKQRDMKYRSQSVVTNIIPAIDNFERALNSATENEHTNTFLTGFKMIHGQLLEVLSQEGVEVIATEGALFDPNVHQAVMQEAVAGVQSGMVLQELQKGYKLKDRVIRPSMVKVSE
ncbi:MAG: nucleotide exchange factor GrpE [Turicibacter sp.]